MVFLCRECVMGYQRAKASGSRLVVMTAKRTRSSAKETLFLRTLNAVSWLRSIGFIIRCNQFLVGRLQLFFGSFQLFISTLSFSLLKSNCYREAFNSSWAALCSSAMDVCNDGQSPVPPNDAQSHRYLQRVREQ